MRRLAGWAWRGRIGDARTHGGPRVPPSPGAASRVSPHRRPVRSRARGAACRPRHVPAPRPAAPPLARPGDHLRRRDPARPRDPRTRRVPGRLRPRPRRLVAQLDRPGGPARHPGRRRRRRPARVRPVAARPPVSTSPRPRTPTPCCASWPAATSPCTCSATPSAARSRSTSPPAVPSSSAPSRWSRPRCPTAARTRDAWRTCGSRWPWCPAGSGNARGPGSPRSPARVRAEQVVRVCFGDPSRVPEHRLVEAAEEIARRGGLAWAQEAGERTARGLVASWWWGASPWAAAARVQAPTLVVWGDRDRLVSPAAGRPDRGRDPGGAAAHAARRRARRPDRGGRDGGPRRRRTVGDRAVGDRAVGDR